VKKSRPIRCAAQSHTQMPRCVSLWERPLRWTCRRLAAFRLSAALAAPESACWQWALGCPGSSQLHFPQNPAFDRRRRKSALRGFHELYSSNHPRVIACYNRATPRVRIQCSRVRHAKQSITRAISNIAASACVGPRVRNTLPTNDIRQAR